MAHHDITGRGSPLAQALTTVGGMLALMWGLEAVDVVTFNSLDSLGIEPRQFSGLAGILIAPFLHFGWAHLISNSAPFLVLGVLVFISGVKDFVWTTVVVVLCSGLTAWLLSPPGSITAGASGVVFGWLAYLLIRGVFTRSLTQIAVAVVVFMLYGSVLWGVLPGVPGVSWQGHLGGAAGGCLAAWLLHGRGRLRS